MRRQASIVQTRQKSGTSTPLNASFLLGKTKRAAMTTMGLRTLAKGRRATTITTGHPTTRDDAGSQHSQLRMIKETKTFTAEQSDGNNWSLSADLER